ncbi:hypothetical protein LOS78_12670 [Paracoccus sp. MA]|uniref:hypothetical protein n=1 Tax=Paracoccus sp. MA TaxID=2895796 RepID=UPI001E3A1EBE|nr:hypothetical protein [Paracoccus sp. MA]UFM66779.1 hypothetical protein LOS78_12670 [Paracoccus sp. MA]
MDEREITDDPTVSDGFRNAVAGMIALKRDGATDDEIDNQIKVIAVRAHEAHDRMGITLTESSRRMQLRIIDSDETEVGYDWLVWLDKVH